ncbi:MAG: universal stress protein [Flavobacteriaceae bacterium]
MEIKNILVATDFSNNAYSALFYATKLLAPEKCTFYLLNTYTELTPLNGQLLPGFDIKKLLKQLEAQSQEKLTSTSHKIVRDTANPNHTFKVISQKGDLVKVIKEKLTELHIDLVIMGNKGLTAAADIFFGSNTIKVANKVSGCPILAIPGEYDFKMPEEIAFVTDFEKYCNKSTLTPLLKIAELSKASIQVLHIDEEKFYNPTREANRKTLQICLRQMEHSFQTVREFDDKAKVIDVLLEKMDIDMYAMVNYPHNLFQKLTHEPIIKDVSMYSDLPFLILPPKD